MNLATIYGSSHTIFGNERYNPIFHVREYSENGSKTE